MVNHREAHPMQLNMGHHVYSHVRKHVCVEGHEKREQYHLVVAS